MKHMLILSSLLMTSTAFADVHLYLPVDGLKTPVRSAQIRVYGGQTKALHDLLPADLNVDGTRFTVMTEQGPLAVISCVRDYKHPGTGQSMSNYLCTIAIGEETAVHDYWPLQRYDMGGPYSGPTPVAGVAGLNPGDFPENGEILFWGKSTGLFSESLPSPVTFEGPHWKVTLGCQRDYVDPKTKTNRHDSLCKLILRRR